MWATKTDGWLTSVAGRDAALPDVGIVRFTPQFVTRLLAVGDELHVHSRTRPVVGRIKHRLGSWVLVTRGGELVGLHGLVGQAVTLLKRQTASGDVRAAETHSNAPAAMEPLVIIGPLLDWAAPRPGVPAMAPAGGNSHDVLGRVLVEPDGHLPVRGVRQRRLTSTYESKLAGVARGAALGLYLAGAALLLWLAWWSRV